MGKAREIEITPAMVAAGVAALQTYRVEGDDSALAAAVYSAMERLSTPSVSSRRSPCRGRRVATLSVDRRSPGK